MKKLGIQYGDMITKEQASKLIQAKLKEMDEERGDQIE